ncbi:MAG: hypothetical protein HY744_11070 [Deltaproteobacteria bacterium]|nr:hypothetical protein [Deltaproteobacteria bacterium]
MRAPSVVAAALLCGLVLVRPAAAQAPEDSGQADLLAELQAAEAADAAQAAKARRPGAVQAADRKAEDPLERLPQGAREVVGNEANPAMSIILDFAGAVYARERHLRPGGYAPGDNGPALQDAELAASAAIDPFFRLQGAVALAEAEIEELYLATTSLPLNLQLRAGKLKSSIGRLNPMHPHQWSFITSPLGNDWLFGEEGLALPGLEISVLLPLPWYVELVGALQAGAAGSFGAPVGTDAIGFGDFVYPLRLVQFFDLSDDWAVQLGTSGVLGRSAAGSETGERSYAAGTDLMFKWRPIGWGKTGYTSVAWVTEAWLRQMDVPGDRWRDAGGYSDLVFGIDKQWQAAVRGECWRRLGGGAWSAGIDRAGFGLDAVRASAQVSYLPSHFSRVRLQYTFERIDGFEDGHIGLLQLEVSAGAHGAHAY